MAKKSLLDKFECKNMSCGARAASTGNTVYALGFAGALIYFIQQTTSFNDFFFGLIKAVLWPAILVYQAFRQLGF